MLINNPFLYSNPVSSEDFIGRKSELRKIVGRIINAGQSTSITGPFRCGKTSVLQYLMEPKQQKNLYGDKAATLIFSYLDIASLSNQCDQAQFWTHALYKLKQRIDIDSPLDHAYQECKQHNFNNYVLEKLITQIKQANLRLVLMLDGFDALLHHKVLNSTEFFGGLRTLATLSHGALALIFTGNTSLSQLNLQTQHFNRTGSPYFNFMDEVILGPLADDDIDKLLRLGDDYFTKDDHCFIKQIAGANPYVLQLTASILFDSYKDKNDQSIEERHINVGKDLYKTIKEQLNITWNYWDNNMKKVFLSIAVVELGKDARYQYIDIKSINREAKNYKTELDNLEQYGFIRRDDRGDWQVYTGIFLRFIDEKIKDKYRGKDQDKNIAKQSSMFGNFLRKLGL